MTTAAAVTIPLPIDPSREPGRNQYKGSCVVCGHAVAQQAGSLYQADDNGRKRWCTVCPSRECFARVFGGDAADDKGRREIDSDGRVWMGNDPGARALLRAIATWDPAARYWTALQERGDRALVLDVATRLELAVPESWRAEPWPAHVVARVDAARAAVAAQGHELRDYQAEGIAWLSTHDRALLADDMGLGKTLQLLFAAPTDHGLVIVCPAVVKGVWAREIRKWLPERFDNVHQCKGRKGFRWPTSPRECVIVNYDILPPQAAEGKGTPCGTPPCSVTLIADEAHALKNNKALRTKRFRSLAAYCAIVWGASGTPVDAHPFELWGTLASLGCKPIGWHAFLAGFNGSKNQWGGYEFGRDSNGAILVEDGITERLRRSILRRTKGEVAGELPPKVFSEHVVEITPALARELTEIAETWIDRLLLDELPPFEAMGGVRKALASACIKAAVDLVKEYEEQGTPLVVFSAHRAPVEEIGSRPGWGMIIGGMSPEARTAVEDAFQRGELLGVACTIQAAGVGITLTHASSMLFVDEDWTMKGNKQAQDRCHRIGQAAGSVDIVRLVPDHALARHVAALLQAKETFVARTMHGFASYERGPDDGGLVAEDAEAWRARVDAHQIAQAEIVASKRQRELAALASNGRKLTAVQAEERAGLRLRARGEQATAVPVAAVQAAFSYMLSVCDGAREKDDVGFNAPDAAIARWVFSAVRAGSPNATTCAWTLLRHYPRQLEARWPEIFESR